MRSESSQAQDPVYSDATAGWVHDQRPWLWLAIAVAGRHRGVLGIRWLLVQLRSDSLGRIALDTDCVADPGSGRADLPAGALTAAVGAEIDSYPGVSKVHASLVGDPTSPNSG